MLAVRTPSLLQSSYRNAVLNSVGLVAYWRLGEASGTVVKDECGKYNGAYMNTPTLGVAGALSGDPNTAMGLTATLDQSFKVSGGVGALATWSIGVWVKGGAASGGSADRIFSTSGNVIEIGRDAPTGITQFYFGTGWVSLNTVVATSWVFMVVTFDGTNYRSYKDGVLVTGPLTGGRALTAVDTSFGASGTEALEGILDEPAIWNRALSAPEIANYYRIGRGF